MEQYGSQPTLCSQWITWSPSECTGHLEDLGEDGYGCVKLDLGCDGEWLHCKNSLRRSVAGDDQSPRISTDDNILDNDDPFFSSFMEIDSMCDGDNLFFPLGWSSSSWKRYQKACGVPSAYRKEGLEIKLEVTTRWLSKIYKSCHGTRGLSSFFPG